MLSIFTFSLIGKQEPLVMIASRLVAIPLLAAVGYEILRVGAKYRHNPLVRVIMYPGILVQMITTKRPDDDMIEVAITSMQEALVADGNAVPEGSTAFEREPLDVAGPTDAEPTEEPVTSAVATAEGGDPPPLA
jgi:uncharacterized protein YqhQ